MPSQSKTLFFIHLPKTGGLTVNNHIYGFLRDGEGYPAGTGSPPQEFHDVARLRSRLQSNASQPRFVTGHFPFYLTRDFKHAPVTATVMRDPVERTLSQLKMLASLNSDLEGLSPEAIYETPFYFALLMDNMQTRLLSAAETDGMKNFTDHVSVDDTRLAAAKNSLHRIEILGFQSHLEYFIAAIAARFGWEKRSITSINVSARKWDVSDAFRRRIADDCRYDVELYAYACQLARGRVAAMA